MLSDGIVAVSPLSLAMATFSSGERPVLRMTTLGWVVLNALAKFVSDDFRLVSP